ncbi:hypothetical protein WG925_08370 [Pseudonocardia carboxydivorans]|uniref:Uncharacterized protein n=1 Tax=Pseudonocardia alni subsp. carboxydivorans TaxID=415010 RepID=A0ABU9ABF7_PSEA5
MRAVDDVFEESLRVRQLGALRADPAQPPLDRPGTARLTPVEHEPDLGEAHTDIATGLDDAETADVFLGVLPMARRGTVGNDDPLVVPVPQDVHLDADPPGGLADLQLPTSFRLDLRST